MLVNAIIFAVVGLLFVFGDSRSGAFIGIIIVFNIFLGVAQDFRARVALEKLQLLTALRVMRINADKTETLVFPEEITRGDQIRLKVGDQVPCDGAVVDSRGLEVSEALLTGESDSFAKGNGDALHAGAIVTTGGGVFVVEALWGESRIAKMSVEAKKYVATPSPIQHSINSIITYSGYILVLVILFVVFRGYLVHEPMIQIVKNIGALASVIVPQGLVVITTLLFAFGAASYSSRHVLFQEINATEKLGRIKNLCMDKTGTLTENLLVVEDMNVPEGSEMEDAKKLTLMYISGSEETSQTMTAVRRYFEGEANSKPGDDGGVYQMLPFSSWRQYGAVCAEGSDASILVGAPDVFLAHIEGEKERQWLSSQIRAHASGGKRMLCVARMQTKELPRDLSNGGCRLSRYLFFAAIYAKGYMKQSIFFRIVASLFVSFPGTVKKRSA